MSTATVSEIMDGVYERLGRPKTATLSPGFVYSMISESLEYYLNQLNISDSNWILGSAEITVSANVDTYTLEIESFGRPVLVETAGTSGNELYIRRYLDLVDKQNLQPNRLEPIAAVTPTLAVYKHNSSRVAFFTDALTGLQQIQFDPTPVTSCKYRIFFEPTGLNKPAIAQVPQFLANFNSLLKTDAALKCLPYMAEEFSQVKFTALQAALSAQLARLESQFNLYVLNDHSENAGYINGFNAKYRDWYGM